jgi:predicted signal transduction protein with EAL and GGDEF domain
MTIVAEGVEETGQLRMLRDLGLESAQGYLFSRPAGESDVAAMLETPWPWGFDKQVSQKREERRFLGLVPLRS